eukprot:COSAG01_NODE_108_length_25947_cov_25.489593_5_plen_108_part_00
MWRRHIYSEISAAVILCRMAMELLQYRKSTPYSSPFLAFPPFFLAFFFLAFFLWGLVVAIGCGACAAAAAVRFAVVASPRLRALAPAQAAASAGGSQGRSSSLPPRA